MTYATRRFDTALNTNRLTTQKLAFEALQSAIIDCRYAGVDPVSDPAVAMLLQHTSCFGVDTPDTIRTLRAKCCQAINALLTKPAIVQAIENGTSNNPDAKQEFLAEAMKLLKRLAAELNFAPETYTITSFNGGDAVGGEAVLYHETLYVMVMASGVGAQHVMYRTCRYKGDSSGDNRWTDIESLLYPRKFAEIIQRHIGRAGQKRADHEQTV